MGLIIAVYIQWHTFGERPHVGPMALSHWKRVPMHFLVMLSICVLNVSLLSSVIARSLTSLLSSIVSPQTSMGRRDHFLFHVNMTILVLSAPGGANTKVPDMYGVGGCFRDPKHKSNMYTFVQQRGGVHILSRITKV